MLNYVFVVLALGHTVTLALPAVSAPSDTCESLIASATRSSHLTPGSPPLENVGHVIHSLTVADLQKFEPTANEINYVPVINKNLTSYEALLPHAPLGMTDSPFTGEGARALDAVLRHMDDQAYGGRELSTLERVIHMFHMRDMWAKALLSYPEVKAVNPSDAVCRCVMDVTHNGIIRMQRNIAMALREPMLVYASNSIYKRDRSASIVAVYGGMQLNNYKLVLGNHDDGKKEEDYSEDQFYMPRLDGAAAWEKWTEMLTMDPDTHYNTALFLYCALNKPRV